MSVLPFCPTCRIPLQPNHPAPGQGICPRCRVVFVLAPPPPPARGPVPPAAPSQLPSAPPSQSPSAPPSGFAPPGFGPPPDPPSGAGAALKWVAAGLAASLLMAIGLVLVVVIATREPAPPAPPPTPDNPNPPPPTNTDPPPPKSDAEQLDALVTVVRAGAPADRVTAVRRIGAVGRSALPAVPTLVQAAEQGDAEVSEAVAEALARIGHDPAANEVALRFGLVSKSAVARAYYLRGLAALRGLSAESARAAAGLLADPDPVVRRAAVAAVAAAGSAGKDDALYPLLLLAADPDTGVRDAAAAAVRGYGPPTAADKPALFKALGSKEPAVKKAAGDLAAPLVTTASEAAALWRPALADPSAANRVAAVGALGKWYDGSAAGRRDFLPLLDDPDPGVRAAAIDVTAKAAADEELKSRYVNALTGSRDATVRGAASRALFATLNKTEADVPVLRVVLKNGGPGDRAAALNRLAEIRSVAAAATPDAVAALSDPDPGVQLAAMKLVAALDPDAQVPAVPRVKQFVTARNTPDEILVLAVVVLGGHGRDGVDSLKKLMDRPLSVPVAVELIRTFGKAGKLAADSWVWMLNQAEANPGTRDAAAAALRGKGNQVVAKELIERVSLFRSRKPTEPEHRYAPDYRAWAIGVAAAANLDDAEQPTRDQLYGRLKTLASSEKTPLVRQAAEKAVKGR